MSTGYFDGNYSAPYLSRNVVSYPLSDKPNNTNTACFDLTYYQWANTFVPAAVGATDNNAPNAFLYMQGPAERVGGGLVKYTRSLCQIPSTWYEMEQMQYAYPGLDSGVGTNNWIPYGLRSVTTVQKMATVRHDYTLNANIPFGNVSNVTIITLFGQPINRIGQWSAINATLTVPSTDPASYVLSSDPQRWKGSIWEIVTKTIGQANVFFP